MKAVKKGVSLILSPNFFCENEYNVVVQPYIRAHHYKASRVIFVMMRSDVRLYDTIIFVFRTEVLV